MSEKMISMLADGINEEIKNDKDKTYSEYYSDYKPFDRN